MKEEVNEGGLKNSEKKWGKKTMEAGFIVIPSVLISKQQKIGLDPLDLNILLHLISYWWEKDNAPFPSKRVLADAIGIDPSTIRRRIKKMEAANFVRREQRFSQETQMSNRYNLSGLVDAMGPLAVELLEKREEQQTNTSKRASKKAKAKKKIRREEE